MSEVIDRIISEMSGRSGFDHVWDSMSVADKAELREEWNKILRATTRGRELICDHKGSIEYVHSDGVSWCTGCGTLWHPYPSGVLHDRPMGQSAYSIPVREHPIREHVPKRQP